MINNLKLKYVSFFGSFYFEFCHSFPNLRYQIYTLGWRPYQPPFCRFLVELESLRNLLSNDSKFVSFGTMFIQSGSKVIQMGSCLFQSVDTHNFTEVPTFWITHGCIVEIKAQSGHLKLIFGHLYGIRMNLFTFVNLILAFSTSIWLKQSIDGKLVMKSFKWYQLYNIWF